MISFSEENEYKMEIGELFKQADKNLDGTLNLQESTKLIQEIMGDQKLESKDTDRIFSMLDKDKNGVWSY